MPALRTRDTPLEVTTEAPPQPPALTIIAPTPRAFTFPNAHTLHDSPYSTPSNSPEPDPCPSFTTTCTTPASTLIRTLSPETSPQEFEPSPSSTTTLHKRRKSSSSDAERRPKKGDDDYIKRPENAFILFRRACCEERQAAQDSNGTDSDAKKPRQADLSKNISQMWKGLSAAERQVWENKAKEKKKEHEMMYPDYVYRPQRSKKERKSSKKGKQRSESLESPESDTVSFMLPTSSRQHGRSASAPTPPPYQSFAIPNIFGGSPSCPTSPSLMPMISRRASHAGNPEDMFDYMPPSDSLMPPASFTPGTSFENSPFLRTMFGQPADLSHLPRLSVSSDGGLLPGQAFSPGSSVGSSSGPSSPNSGPFTPTTTMLAQSFAQLNAGFDSSTCSDQPMTQEQLQEQIQLQMFQQQHDLDLSGYAWDSNTIWPEGSEMLLGDDFDISSIPPIEIGVPKFGEELHVGLAPDEADYQHSSQESYSQGSSQDPHQQVQPLLGFDEMMAGKGF